LPAATQVTLELGAFAAASALAGRLDPVSLASHQIALNLASLTFMVPLGVASAGAVRVGQAVGRRDAPAAARAGRVALLVGTAFMTAAACAFVLVPQPLVGMFTSSTAVFALGRRLLLVAAMFQLFDGLQGVCTGLLRGLGDTRTPMIGNLAGHWLLGLPVGYALCFWWGWGVIGLWAGLSTGLIVIGLGLAITWRRRIRALNFDALR
jgi:MATE family multidrug resistance protein